MSRVLLMLVVGLVAAACGSTEGGLRDEGLVADGERAVVSPAVAGVEDSRPLAPVPAPGVAVVYFLRFDAPAPTRRSVPVGATIAEAGLKALLDGPTAAERSLRYATAIPDEARLLGYRLEGRTATIDISVLPDPVVDGDSEALLALYQLVYTVTAGGGVEAVKVRADGRPYGLSTLTGGSGALEPPLTRADLGFVAAAEAQPGSLGCATVAEGDPPFRGTPQLVLRRPREDGSVRGILQLRGRLEANGGPIVIRILQNDLEVTNRIIDLRCRGNFSASIPVPRTLTGEVELIVSTPATDDEPSLEVRRPVTIVVD